MESYIVNVAEENKNFFEQLLTKLNVEFFGTRKEIPNEETVSSMKEADEKFKSGVFRGFKSAAEMQAALLAEDDDD